MHPKNIIPLLRRIEALVARGERTVLAIDGPAAAGKTTLAASLAKYYTASVIHMDDFFLRPEQRTVERYAEPGGNLDRERFLTEVIPYLKERREFSYQRFDCGTMQLCGAVTVSPSALLIVEGSYSLHPAFLHHYDVKLFLDISDETQKARILDRNGREGWERFSERWIPLEQSYFSAFSVRETADFVLCGEDLKDFQ